MKKITGTIMCIFILFMSPSALYSAQFAYADVPPSHWAFNVIYQSVDKGYMKAFSNGFFQPEQKITRSDFLTSLSFFMKNPEQKLLTHPNMPITRGEVAYIIYSFMAQSTKDSHIESSAPVSFNDVTKNNLSIPFCADKTIMRGYPDGSFKPFQYITRAEAAVILNNIDRILALSELISK